METGETCLALVPHHHILKANRNSLETNSCSHYQLIIAKFRNDNVMGITQHRWINCQRTIKVELWHGKS